MTADMKTTEETLEKEAIKETKEVLEEKKEESLEDEVQQEVSLEEKIGKLKVEIEDWKQSYLRKQADFQNFTKRKEKEIEELRQYSSQKIIEKLLGSLDNLERAISATKETNDFDGLVQGVEMILRNIQDIMKSEGVEEIEAVGKQFDPLYHHAVLQESSEDFQDNEIMLELQKGYKMKDKVIRPSMVKVCKKA